MKSGERDHRSYLEDILLAISRIESYTAKGEKEFFNSILVQDAVIRQLSVLGEAASKLPLNLKKKHTTIPWKEIIGMRNIIIHEYSMIDLPIIWDTVSKGLPPLKRTVEKILQKK